MSVKHSIQRAHQDLIPALEWMIANALIGGDRKALEAIVKDILEVLMNDGTISDLILQIIEEKAEKYSNSTPVPQSIGGIMAGQTFDQVSYKDMFDQLLYPNQNPVVSFSITPSTSQYGEGNIATITRLTANIIKKTDDIAKVVFKKNGTVISTDTTVRNTSFEIVYDMNDAITANTTYSVEVTTVNSIMVSASRSVQFLPYVYSTVSTTNSLPSIISNINSADSWFSPKVAQKVSFDGPLGGYMVACFPAEWGEVTTAMFLSYETLSSFTHLQGTIKGKLYNIYVSNDYYAAGEITPAEAIYTFNF